MSMPTPRIDQRVDWQNRTYHSQSPSHIQLTILCPVVRGALQLDARLTGLDRCWVPFSVCVHQENQTFLPSFLFASAHPSFSLVVQVPK